MSTVTTAVGEWLVFIAFLTYVLRRAIVWPLVIVLLISGGYCLYTGSAWTGALLVMDCSLLVGLVSIGKVAVDLRRSNR